MAVGAVEIGLANEGECLAGGGLGVEAGFVIQERSGDNAAADVLKGIITGLYVAGKRTNGDLWAAITSPVAEIAKLCASTSAGLSGHKQIEDISSKQTQRIIAIIISHTRWLEYIGADGDFCISEWLKNTPPGSFIFITTVKYQLISTLIPCIGLFIDLVAQKVLSLPDGQPKLFLVLDEFKKIQKLPNIKRLLNVGVYKKCTVIISIQCFDDIQNYYNDGDAQTIYHSFGTNLIFCVADPMTAKIISNRIGVDPPIILPTEIQSLPKLSGYLKIPEHEPALIKIEILEVKNDLTRKHEPFLLKPGFTDDDLAKIDERTSQAITTAKSSKN